MSFDGVMIQAVLEHVLEPTRVVAEIHRVLKPDGLLAFSYHHSRDEGWSAVLEALMRAVTYTNLKGETYTLPLWQMVCSLYSSTKERTFL